jgi:hypothetical protein
MEDRNQRLSSKLLGAGLAIVALASCANSSPSTTTTHSPSPAARYLVGADPADDPCARIVSAIGYADQLLRPAGEEDGQDFGEGVRGRLAYIQGVVLEYGPRLPENLLADEAVVQRTTHDLSPAGTPKDEQIRLLREYRSAAESIKKGCADG